MHLVQGWLSGALKDPRDAVMELGVVEVAIDPHFVNDFKAAVTESA